eukprot:673924-Amphidinium_carterae.1
MLERISEADSRLDQPPLVMELLFDDLAMLLMLLVLIVMLQLVRSSVSCFQRSYLSTIKRTIGLPRILPSTWQELPEDQVLAITGEPPLGDVLRSQRLLFLQRLLVSDNPINHALMCIGGARTVWATWLKDLDELRKRIEKFHHMPTPNMDTRPIWCNYIIFIIIIIIIIIVAEWRTMIKTHLQRRHKTAIHKLRTIPPHFFTDTYHDPISTHVPLIHITVPPPQQAEMPDDVTHAEPHPDPPVKFTCHICNRTFDSHRGVSLYKRRMHDIMPALALRIKDNKCIICGSQLTSPLHLLEHLSKRLECGLGVLHQVPAI